jgi:hypothetical protein
MWRYPDFANIKGEIQLPEPPQISDHARGYPRRTQPTVVQTF